MDINTIADVVRPGERTAIPPFGDGDAWLGGGTWLFSEPQPGVRRMIDLAALDWPAIAVSPDRVEIAATCTIAELAGFAARSHWRAAPLIDQCAHALLGSFKIWNMATVGGNICLALPAGPMIALAVALDATGVIWSSFDARSERHIRIADFVLAPRLIALRPGELLRSLEIAPHALERRYAFRKISLNPLGRSGALLIGMRDASENAFVLTITAATPRPVRLAFSGVPDDSQCLAAIDAALGDVGWYGDVHGRPDWRRHVTHHLATEILDELRADVTA